MIQNSLMDFTFTLMRVINTGVQKTKEVIMTKKNLKVSALKHEISVNLDRVLEVLEKLKFVNSSEVFLKAELTIGLITSQAKLR